MAVVSVVGHFAGGSDHHAILAALSEPVVRGDVVTGRVGENDLDTLRERGLVIHRVIDREESEPLAPRARHWMLGAVALPDVQVESKADVAAYGEVVVLRTVPVPPPDWRARLTAFGAAALERVSADRYVVWVPRGRRADVSGLGFVADVRPYEVRDTVDLANVVSPGGPPPSGAAPVLYEVLAHRPEDVAVVRDWLAGQGWPEEGLGRRKIRFRCRFGDPALLELARRPEVAALDLYVPPEPLNDHAQSIVGLRPPDGENGLLGLTGLGQIVGVADTGLDADHPDLRDRLLKIIARGRPNDASDPHGHGTHVAATALGDGVGAGGTFRGAAPGAMLFFQSVMDEHGQLTGLPVDLNELLQEAYDAGVRVHNNSWGADSGAVYRMSSMEIDEFVAEHPDMLVVVAAGNSGSAAAPRHVACGHADLFSINAPATAKNALTVGASRSTRCTPAQTWGRWAADRFPDPPIADEFIGGDPESLAAFSSRGPCQEHERIKPDVVAPGTCVVSARSASASDSSFWATWDDHYAVMGGTSMAAPLVAGAAALAREWFVARGHLPSAALLKATIVNGARWLTGRDAVADHPTAPNFHQGFGLMDLRRSLADDFLFVDTWAAGSRCSPLRRLGQTVRLPLRCDGPASFDACLVWTDPPGRGVQHALSLVVSHPAGRALGNHARPARLRTVDSANNVQIVRIDAAEAGEYRIEVTAISEMLYGPQDFAVAVSCTLADAPEPMWQNGAEHWRSGTGR